MTNQTGRIMATTVSKRQAPLFARPDVGSLAATLGLSAVCWVVAVREMTGMDMGVATRLGPFGFFIAVWVTMMGAMMLPGTVPAVLRNANLNGALRAVPLFVAPYLVVWALVGIAVFAVYQPHGTVVAGLVAIAAGIYELTPVKQHFRQACRENTGSGFGFGVCCVGSSIGLMLMMVALGVMSVTWMAVVAIVGLAQKLLPTKAAIDLTLGLAIVGFGALILITPSAVPGLAPPM
jgi:predicted metal-binding membrane protein